MWRLSIPLTTSVLLHSSHGCVVEDKCRASISCKCMLALLVVDHPGQKTQFLAKQHLHSAYLSLWCIDLGCNHKPCQDV